MTESHDVIELRGPLHDRDAWSAEQCSMDRALKVIGKRSNMLLLREAYYGSTRFDEFVRRTGLSEPVVAAELRHLVEVGLLTRVPYREAGERERLAYRLTDLGRDAFVPVVALMQWGDRWLAPTGGPIDLFHGDCGAKVSVELRCDEGHTLSVRDVEARPRRRSKEHRDAHSS